VWGEYPEHDLPLEITVYCRVRTLGMAVELAASAHPKLFRDAADIIRNFSQAISGQAAVYYHPNGAHRG